MIDETGNLRQTGTQVKCLYQIYEALPKIYPTAPSSNPAATLAKPASVDGYSGWTTIIPAATIDADTTSTYFNVNSLEILNVPGNSYVYFEMQYNSVTVGRGHVTASGTGARLTKGSDFGLTAMPKVTGQDLKMRISDENAGANNYAVGPIMWCEGNP